MGREGTALHPHPKPSSFTPQFSRAPLQSWGSERFLLATKQGDAAAAPCALHTPRLTEFKGCGSRGAPAPVAMCGH